MSQPGDVYPYPVIRSQPDTSHSNGSYGPVFIVLAVIFVIAVVACVFGRLCNRRRNKEVHHHHHQSHHHQSHHYPPKSNVAEQSRGLGPKEWEAREQPRITLRERADLDFGMDKRFPSAKLGNHGGGVAPPPGWRRPEVRFADNV